jgi:hypothetical protein
VPEYRVKRSLSTEDLPKIIGLLADAYVESANAAGRRRILDSATRGQQLLCGFCFYWDDVTNGGHWQYYWNCTGNLWREALETTHVLCLPEQKVLRAAVALFPEKQPDLTQTGRRGHLATIDRGKLDKLDERFYALSGAGEQIQQYIDTHPDEFFLPKRSK